MCNFKSGIILKNKVVLAPEGNESHSDLLENLEIEDTHMNASKTFVRAELIPKNNDKMTNVKDWRYKVDQDIVPDWYEKDPERYEQNFRNAVEEYMNEWRKQFKSREIGTSLSPNSFFKSSANSLLIRSLRT